MGDLVDQASRGDVGAFDVLVGKDIERTVRIATAILGSQAEARAVAREALTVVWQGLPTLRTRGQYAVWADRILINGCRACETRRDPDVAQRAPGLRSPTSERLTSRPALELAFDRLGTDARALLALHHLEHMALSDIADRLEIPRDVAALRLQRARQRGDVRAMLSGRTALVDPSGLRPAIVSAARMTPQVGRGSHRLRGRVSPGNLVAAVVGLVALAVLLDPTQLPLAGGLGSGIAPSGVLSGMPFNPPRVVAVAPPPPMVVCPVTPMTVVAGEAAPVAVASGVRWDWGGDNWQVGLSERVTVRLQATGMAPRAAEILAEHLWLGSGAPATTAGFSHRDALARALAVAGDATAEIDLPAPGCWLLSLIGPSVRSSVVVYAAADPASSPEPASRQIPAVRDSLGALTTCPLSPAQGSGTGQAWADGDIAWQDPTPGPWLAGVTHRLRIDGIDGDQSPERVVAMQIDAPATPESITNVPVIASLVRAGSSEVALLTLPSRGCWAIAYVAPTITSTIVIEVR